jgi:hypothetical protein
MQYDTNQVLNMNVNAALVNILTSAMEGQRYVKILTKGGYATSELKVLSVGCDMVFVNMRCDGYYEVGFFLIEQIAAIFIDDLNNNR